jgi:hypothetical protein
LRTGQISMNNGGFRNEGCLKILKNGLSKLKRAK